MNKIGQYVNGNTIVVIYDDGTKERYFRDGDKAVSDFPESIDLKITNRCNMGCPMCAECSTPRGDHANLHSSILDSIHPYTELAIGGGNPLEHPGLVPFLQKMRDQKVICNMTVNANHFLENDHFLRVLVEEKLIYGIGVSLPEDIPDRTTFFREIEKFPNLVVHTIAGFTPLQTYKALEKQGVNLLILGFKQKGYGKYFINEAEARIKNREKLLRMWMEHMPFKSIAFDNLAVEQFKIKEWMPEEEYNKLYMGDDGDHTMYIDLVNMQYGKSSTHELHPIGSDDASVEELFKKLKE